MLKAFQRDRHATIHFRHRAPRRQPAHIHGPRRGRSGGTDIAGRRAGASVVAVPHDHAGRSVSARRTSRSGGTAGRCRVGENPGSVRGGREQSRRRWCARGSCGRQGRARRIYPPADAQLARHFAAGRTALRSDTAVRSRSARSDCARAVRSEHPGGEGDIAVENHRRVCRGCETPPRRDHLQLVRQLRRRSRVGRAVCASRRNQTAPCSVSRRRTCHHRAARRSGGDDVDDGGELSPPSRKPAWSAFWRR